MAKLRVVKDRVTEVGHESDLRGLGEDKSLLNDVVPMPTLSIRTTETAKDEIEQVCISMGFSVTLNFESDVLHIQPAQPTERFKEDLIDLFGLMLMLESKIRPAYKRAHLWLWDRMRDRIHGTGEEDKSSFKKSFKSVAKKIEQKNMSCLHDGVSIYLRQAGFTLPRSVESIRLTNSIVEDNIKLLFSSIRQDEQLRAGGDQ